MKNIRDDRWTDWLIDEEHRWENIDRVKPARWILGILFLLLFYLIIGLIFAGLSMLILHAVDLETIGSNTILPFPFYIVMTSICLHVLILSLVLLQ